MADKKIGFGTKRLVSEIISNTWGVSDANNIKLTLNDILYIIQEMQEEEGKKHLTANTKRGHNVFKHFVKHLLMRNLANYDSMVLLTSEKGCVTGDSLIKTEIHPNGISIKQLLNKGPINVYSYNIKTKKIEIKQSDGVEFAKYSIVYKISFSNKQTITATPDHPFILIDGTQKQLKHLTNNDKILYVDNGIVKFTQQINIEKLNKQDVYDVVNVKDNHNFICNSSVVANTGKSSAAITMAREWCLQLGIRFDPKRHLAYNNKDVMEKIDMLNKFEPLVCLSGDTEISVVNNNGIVIQIPIKKLNKKIHSKLITYNEKFCNIEIKTYEKVIKTKTNAEVYKLELKGYNSSFEPFVIKSIKCTAEHKFLTDENGWVQLKDIKKTDKIQYYVSGQHYVFFDIMSITKQDSKEDVYDIVGVKDNHNFVANNMFVHNCDESVRFASSADWAKKDSKELRRKLSEVRTKHLLFVLCFPLKIHKMEKNYLESFVNYWCITGDTKIKIRDKTGMIRNTQIKNLNKYNPEVLTYNIKSKIYEFKKYDKIIKSKINAEIFELELENGLKIKCTDDHPFLTQRGWVRLKYLNNIDKIEVENQNQNKIKIKSIKKLKQREDVYDIIGVKDNHNFIANNMVVHNCDLFGRGQGAIYVKDRNPNNDPWRMKDFKSVGSYTEFTRLSEIEKKLKKHPNFWQIIKFPKPPAWLYTKYLEVREKNVYDNDSIREMVTTGDVHKALLMLALQDVMMNDTTLGMNRIMLHIKNTYDIPITKKHIQTLLLDSKHLVTKIREESIN